MRNQGSRWCWPSLLTKGAASAVVALVSIAPSAALAHAKPRAMSLSKGSAAISHYAARVANASSAQSYLVMNCRHHGQARVNCQTLYYFDAIGGAPCVSEAQASYIGSRIVVRPVAGVSCSQQVVGPA